MKAVCYWAAFIIFSLAACHPSPKTVDNTYPAWYKNQVIYNLDVKTFKDSDGDGFGDFKGLTDKLSYLDSLGVTTIWLAPFQPSPWQDDGYDVADYYGIDPRVGNLADLHKFISVAKSRHIRVIMDMVLNHTSIRHPWFRDRPTWYVWSATKPKDWDEGMGFPEIEKETWRLDSLTGGYFFHRFYRFQPDLNFQNPRVLAEAENILKYWLAQGMDGFRLDAVPFIIDDPRPSAADPRHDFYILHDLARTVKKYNPEAALLGEANVKPNETKDYFSHQGDGLDMMLNFEVNEYLFYALATGEVKPLREALNVTAEKPKQDQWVHFLRNHDEIDLGKLDKRQIKTVFSKMAPDTNMQLYKRGIRRRLAPMLDNDLRRLKQAYSLLFALPGTPVLRYGEELGMGDDLVLKERLSVRTPMQWNASRNAGFSTGSKPFRPLIELGEYGYKSLNAQKQQTDTSSLLNHIRKLISLRKLHPEIGQGRWHLPATDNSQCLVINYHLGEKMLLLAFNFSKEEQKITLPDNVSQLKDLISGRNLKIDNGKRLTLPAYAAYWISFSKQR
jgi:maltose alpha-D-glucosyltransferase/alpha-amylase